MEPIAQLPQADFIWRRFLDTPPSWALWLPVGFAFLVIALLALFRDKGWNRLIAPTIVVAILSAIYVVAGYNLFLGLFSWWYLLGPTLAVALFYVALMYRKDSRSVHPAIAGFLGLLRCCVYTILAVVFLLPGCQTFEKSEYRSKILMLYDVSGSMFVRDDIPALGQDPKTLLTRQEKVHRTLTVGDPTQGAKPLLDLILAKSAVTSYRFGSLLDESEVHSWKQAEAVPAGPLAVWLNPDKKNFTAPGKHSQRTSCSISRSATTSRSNRSCRGPTSAARPCRWRRSRGTTTCRPSSSSPTARRTSAATNRPATSSTG